MSGSSAVFPRALAQCLRGNPPGKRRGHRRSQPAERLGRVRHRVRVLEDVGRHGVEMRQRARPAGNLPLEGEQRVEVVTARPPRWNLRAALGAWRENHGARSGRMARCARPEMEHTLREARVLALKDEATSHDEDERSREDRHRDERPGGESESHRDGGLGERATDALHARLVVERAARAAGRWRCGDSDCRWWIASRRLEPAAFLRSGNPFVHAHLTTEHSR